MPGLCFRGTIRSGLSGVFSLIIFLFSNPAPAQSIGDDSVLYKRADSNTISIYNKQLGDQSQLYNGSHYAATGYTFRAGSPYFLSGNFSVGSVVYDGISFDSLSILYEDLRELLVVKNETYLLQLISQRITAFTIAGHSFIRLTADSTNKGISKTGFYEILYVGHLQLLKETFKNIVELPSAYEGMLREINVRYDYYFKIVDSYVQVKSKKDLFDVLHDHQKEIQRFIKKNKLNFRKDKENTLIQTAAFYDQIAT